MRPNLIMLAAVVASACATGEAARRPVPDAPPPPGGAAASNGAEASSGGPLFTDSSVDVAKMDPVRYAESFPRAEFCEEEARRLRASSPDTGWAVLRACVLRGKFTLLSRLIGGAWEKDLQTRSNASVILARVVAARGGDIEGDLAAMRRQRVPIFAVSAALKHPDMYKGRLVLFRAVVRDVKLDKGKTATARLAEYGMGGKSTYVDSDERSVARGSESGSYSNSQGYKSSGQASGELQFLTQRRLTGNYLSETGLEIIARLSTQDPFFEPERQFIVLGRFDGVRDIPAIGPDEAARVALVSVVAYFEPSSSIIE